MPEPRLESPRDAIVRVEVAGLCGSDLHVYRGRERGLDPGTVMGHEFAGTVLEVGDGVRGFRPGDRVVSPFTTSCGACFYCRRGLTARCSEGQLFGWVEGGRGLQGAQAEYVRVPLADSTLVRVPEGVHLEQALLAGDALATASFGVEMAAIEPGAVVAVVGCGPVGILTALAARERGAAPVFAIDVVPERLALAARFGATPLDLSRAHKQTTGGDRAAAFRVATEGRGADAVIEAVGTPEATRLAFELLRPGGVLVALGVHTEDRLAITPGEAYDRNLTYRAGRCPARRFMDELLERIRAGAHDLSPLISHRLPLDDGPRAYELFDRKLDGCIKVVFALEAER